MRLTDLAGAPPPEFSFALGEDLAPLPEYKVAGNTTVDFSGLLGEPISLHEDLRSGCGGQLWPAGMLLARHMLRYQRSKLGKARILELGAGSGLVGLSVARGCSVEVPLYITDQVEMEALMQHNIDLNGLREKVKAVVLNWGEPLSQEIRDFSPNIILAADCVYSEPAFPLLLKTLKDLTELCPSAIIYFCFQKRRRADSHFMPKARKLFQVAEIEDDDRLSFGRESLFLYALAAKR